MAKTKGANPTNIITVDLASDVNANCFVGTDRQVCAADARALGVVDNYDYKSGDTVAITMGGTTYVKFGGTIAEGGEVEVGTDGKAVPYDAGHKVAIALEGGDDGDVRLVKLLNS